MQGQESCRIPDPPSLALNCLIVHEGLTFVSGVVATEDRSNVLAKSISHLADE